MRSVFIVVGLLQLGGGVSLPAQQPAAPFVRWEPSAPASEFTRSGRSGERESDGLGDYRYEGLAIGGVALGALGVWVGSQLRAGCPLQPGGSCYNNTTENAIALGLVGAAVGGGVGYLIGRFSPKVSPSVARWVL
jgi:hypothetical protein